jgi:hypothetical protein
MIRRGVNLLRVLSATGRYGLATEVQTKVKSDSSAKSLTYYKDGQLTTRSAIVLKKKEDIEGYVIKTIQNYFRTTYKAGIKQLIQDSPQRAS